MSKKLNSELDELIYLIETADVLDETGKLVRTSRERIINYVLKLKLDWEQEYYKTIAIAQMMYEDYLSRQQLIKNIEEYESKEQL